MSFARYRGKYLVRVDPDIFSSANDVKDIPLWPLPLQIDDRYGHVSWEHTYKIERSLAFESEYLSPAAHAMYDVRVHAPGRATSVTMRVGTLELPFERYECEYWVLKLFTRNRPLILLPLIADVSIHVGAQRDPHSSSTVSYALYHFTSHVEELLRNDCFLDGPEPGQKIVFGDDLALLDTNNENEWSVPTL